MIDTPTKPSQAKRTQGWVTQAPVFYGWVILLAGSFGMIMTSPGQTYAVSIFIDPLIETLGISRSLISGLYTAGTLLSSLAMPLIGRQIDRWGPQAMVVVIALSFGLACIFMGFVRNALMLGIGFMAIRMFGAGGLGLVSQNVIAQWWVRRRGAVMGLAGLLMSLFGLAAFPSLIHRLLAAFGWQWTYWTLGLMVLFLMVPVGYLCFRSQPEVYGLRPDGAAIAEDKMSPSGTQLVEEHWTLAEARRTPVFWIVAMSLATLAMLSTGLFFHMVSIFEDSGLDASIVAATFMPIALTTALVNLASGLLVDRFPVRLLLAGALGLQALSLWMALALTTVQLAFLYGLVLGTSSGLTRTASSVVWPTYFGRRHLGSITGLSTTVMVAASALGPLPLGIARDSLGSYHTVLIASAVLPLLLGGISLFFGPPRKAPTTPSDAALGA